MDFTKKFIEKNLNKNKENEIFKNSKKMDLNNIDLDYIFNTLNNGNILIHYTLDNDNKFITIYINPNDIDYYHFEIHFSKTFDIKEMISLFLSRLSYNIGLDLIENENRQIIRYG